MELYLGWSLFKYVLVTLLFALIVFGVVKLANYNGEHKTVQIFVGKTMQLVSAVVVVYIIVLLLSLNTGKSMLKVDKAPWKPPVQEVMPVPPPSNNKEEVEEKFDKQVEKLNNSVGS